MRTAISHHSLVSLAVVGARGFALSAILVAALGGAQMLAAQRPALAAAPAHKAAHPHKPLVAALAPSPAPTATPVRVTPPAPEVPAWPANERPVPATINWDSQGLRIDAANSSLAQILVDVATVTGTKVTGFDDDVRVFGVYGPGPARDVLSQLLQGSGYNVMMVGDQGQGTPREIVLSTRHSGGTQPIVNSTPASDEDADADEPPQPQPQPTPPPFRPPFGPGGPPRTPQQMQEFQQRQQQMMQQRQQQGQPPYGPQN